MSGHLRGRREPEGKERSLSVCIFSPWLEEQTDSMVYATTRYGCVVRMFDQDTRRCTNTFVDCRYQLMHENYILSLYVFLRLGDWRSSVHS